MAVLDTGIDLNHPAFLDKFDHKTNDRMLRMEYPGASYHALEGGNFWVDNIIADSDLEIKPPMWMG